MRKFLHTIQVQVVAEIEDRPEDVLGDIYPELAGAVQRAIDAVPQAANFTLTLTDVELQTIEDVSEGEVTR